MSLPSTITGATGGSGNGLSGSTPNPNLSGLAGVSSGAAALTGLLVATPQTYVGYQPQNPAGQSLVVPPSSLAGSSANQFVGNIVPSSVSQFLGLASKNRPSILFHYEGDNTSVLKSDITDHYTETNMPVQDQIAIKPVTVTAQGYIGELNDIPANAALAALQSIANKLTNVSGYLPGLSVAALIAYNEAVFAYNTAINLANTAQSTVQSLAGTNSKGNQTIINGIGVTLGANQNKQQQVYQQFYAYWVDRILFTIQTPWAVFFNMAIETMTAVQAEDTNVISNFEVTFKQIRYVSSLTPAGTIDPSLTQNRAIAQTAMPTNQATSSPSLVDPGTANATTIIAGQQ